MFQYGIGFVITFLVSLFLTPIVRTWARRNGLVDRPERHPERKIHPKGVALGGGIALIMSFMIGVLVAWYAGWLIDGHVTAQKLIGIMAAALVMICSGSIDDKKELSPARLFAWHSLAAFCAVAAGITVAYVTNPFVEGTGPFGRALFYFTERVVPGISLGALVTFGWLLGMMLVTKFLDGLDGLVVGIGVIGSVILFLVSLFWDAPQSGTSVLALLLAGACAGFLVYNWHPAKIFLGESGSVFIGFMLGVLSIISGAKIATTLLIMGIPILDVIWVIARRVFGEKRTPFRGDRKHLHFRLLDAGLSHRQAVLVLYFFAAVFGTSSLFLQSQGKVVALAALTVVMLLLAVLVVRRARKSLNQE